MEWRRWYQHTHTHTHFHISVYASRCYRHTWLKDHSAAGFHHIASSLIILQSLEMWGSTMKIIVIAVWPEGLLFAGEAKNMTWGGFKLWYYSQTFETCCNRPKDVVRCRGSCCLDSKTLKVSNVTVTSKISLIPDCLTLTGLLFLQLLKGRSDQRKHWTWVQFGAECKPGPSTNILSQVSWIISSFWV